MWTAQRKYFDRETGLALLPLAVSIQGPELPATLQAFSALRTDNAPPFLTLSVVNGKVQ